MERKKNLVLILIVIILDFGFISSILLQQYQSEVVIFENPILIPPEVPNNMTNNKYYNYINILIVSARKPRYPHLGIETNSSGIIYMCPIDATGSIYKTIDKADNWAEIYVASGNVFMLWHDRANSRLYYITDYSGVGDAVVYTGYIDLTDDTHTALGTFSGISEDYWPIDIFIISGTVYAAVFHDGDIEVHTWSGAAWVLQDSIASRGSIWAYSYVCIVGSDFYFIEDNQGVDDVIIWKYSGGTISSVDTITDQSLPPGNAQVGIAYDGNDLLYFILKDDGDSKNYLYTYSISGDTSTKLGEYNIVLMLNRNTDSSLDPPNNLEKGFHLTEDKVYQIPSTYSGRLNLISNYNFANTIIAITDHFLMDNSGNMYEYVDLISSILEGMLYHSRQNYPYLKLKFNSDNITIVPQQFIQIIGSYTADGTIYQNKVVFEGIAEAPTEGRIRYVLVKNQGSEMDEVKPNGSKAGRSDQIITDINNDGAPSGPEYIQDGTLSEGAAMGTLVFNKSKTYRKVANDFAEHDDFTWYLKTQGTLDYNNGAVDSGADLRYDGATHTDTLLRVKAWKVAKLNQIIVNGAINSSTGGLYTGQWDDLEDQQANGINSVTIEDASLNTNALCQAKADTMGAAETERTRARFKFRKTIYGFIQPGQTITFKYVVANYMSIAEAEFILDKMILNIKSEVGYAEVSSGL